SAAPSTLGFSPVPSLLPSAALTTAPFPPHNFPRTTTGKSAACIPSPPPAATPRKTAPTPHSPSIPAQPFRPAPALPATKPVPPPPPTKARYLVGPPTEAA